MTSKIIRYAIAGVLLFAALAKTHMLAISPTLPQDGWFGLLEVRWVQIVAVEFEVFWALLLIFNPFPKLIWRGTAVVFSAFAVVSVAKWWLGEASCGCFGRVKINPLYTAIFDTVVVGMLLLFRKHAAQNVENPTRKCVIAAIVWVVVSLPIMFAVNSVQTSDLPQLGTEIIGADGRKTVMLEPEKWVGNEFPLLPYIENDVELLKKGEWTIIVGKPNCAECEKLLNTAISEGAERIALLEFVEDEVETVGSGTKPKVSFRSKFKLPQNEKIIMTPFAVHCDTGVCLEVVRAGD